MIILPVMADDDLPTPSNTDDTPPPLIRRPDTGTPSDSDQDDAEEKALKQQREVYAQKQAELIQKINDSEEKWKNQGEPLVQDIYNSMAAINAAPQDQSTGASLTDEYRQELAKNTQEHGMTAVGALFTLVGMAGLLFGRKRGWGAQSGIYQGLGNAMTLYSQGKEQQSRDQQAKTLKMISLMHQENQERVANKKEILNEKRLTLQQKMDLLKTHHQMFQEQHTDYRDEQSALQGESAMLQKQEQALSSLRRLKYFYHQHTSHMLSSKDAKAWAEYVRVESGGQLDPMRSDPELDAAEKMYPIDQYIQERHDVGKPQEKGKGEKGMSSLTTKKAPEDVIKEKANNWWGTQ